MVGLLRLQVVAVELIWLILCSVSNLQSVGIRSCRVQACCVLLSLRAFLLMVVIRVVGRHRARGVVPLLQRPSVIGPAIVHVVTSR